MRGRRIRYPIRHLDLGEQRSNVLFDFVRGGQRVCRSGVIISYWWPVWLQLLFWCVMVMFLCNFFYSTYLYSKYIIVRTYQVDHSAPGWRFILGLLPPVRGRFNIIVERHFSPFSLMILKWAPGLHWHLQILRYNAVAKIGYHNKRQMLYNISREFLALEGLTTCFPWYEHLERTPKFTIFKDNLKRLCNGSNGKGTRGRAYVKRNECYNVYL